ncbi:unnamed protein product [Mytilus coruscus]|uniref:Flavin-containing monooxygenase n=1 Tax=Mytilus coruscus TaxID=42192 RepID=A0A6J8B6I6_MYTCO|nr:unnamed protein product [Mytilus coruscus]
MKSSSNDSGTVSKKLVQFLLAYRNTKHSTTNETPAKLMIRRDLKTRMNLLRPNIENQVQIKQEEMCDRRKTYQREFKDGQSVVVRDYRDKNKWTPGTISTKTGPVSYRVQIDPTTIWRRHADQIIDSNISSTEQSISEQTTLDNNISSEHGNPTENEHRPQKPEEHKSNQPTTPFNKIVTNAVPKHPGDFKTKWEVAYCHVHEPMNTTTEDFDAVIVCSGNCVFPNVPPFPGLKNFTGRLLHSRNYRNAQEFRGQKVAVVGSSYSGKDVARQLSDVADKVYIVHIDQPLNTIYPNGNVIEKNFGVQSITNSSLVLANGEEIEIDCLIFCTGYRYRFPFLSEDILSIDDEHVSPLYKHILHLEYHSLMDIASEVHWRRDNKLVGPHWHYMDTLQWDFDRSLARIGKFDPLPEILQIYWNFVESHRENDFINYWKYDYCMNENNTIVANKREVSSDFNFSPRKFLA